MCIDCEKGENVTESFVLRPRTESTVSVDSLRDLKQRRWRRQRERQEQ